MKTLRINGKRVRKIVIGDNQGGYFLKICDEYMNEMKKKQIYLSESDWGGYGIVCPEDFQDMRR